MGRAEGLLQQVAEGLAVMDYNLLDNLTFLRSTLTAEARRCTSDPAYCDFLYREWRHITRRIEAEWRKAESSCVVPSHMRSGREGRGERRQAA